MIAALYVVVVFLGGGITHWFGLFLIPLVIYLGDSTAIGIAAGAFLSSFIIPRDPLVVLSALVGGGSNYLATITYGRIYSFLSQAPKVARMEAAGLAACVIITLVDGTRTLLSWQIIFPQITLAEIWAIAFGFSFFSINILGVIITYGLGNLLTVAEKSRAVGRF
jgi:hypothetical protein